MSAPHEQPDAPHEAVPTPRLVLIDTVDQLPGLLPLHAFNALRTCDLVVLGHPGHPMADHLDMAEERYEVIPADLGGDDAALRREELLTGVSLADKARASWVIDRCGDVGSVAYIHGPDDPETFTRTLGMEAVREQVEVEVVYFGLAPEGLAVTDLAQTQARLLAPGGCPWDAEQTHESLARFAIEEAHELAEAIAGGDPADIAEELGDVLMQVVFHAHIAEGFGLDDVARGINEKLIRRHPHVFGQDGATDGLTHAVVDDADKVVANWEDLKAAEKPDRTGPFDGVPGGLPAIALAAKVQSRAERAGFAWPTVEDAAEAVAEELAEAIDAIGALDDPGGAAGLSDEVGDLLFAVISMARAADIDPEHALRSTVARFRERFEDVVDGLDAEGVDATSLTPDAWQARWDAAKR